jgi:hypothetical protein
MQEASGLSNLYFFLQEKYSIFIVKNTAIIFGKFYFFVLAMYYIAL